MRTRIIAAFPGTGKSHYTREHPNRCLDSDSSRFSWREVAIQGPVMGSVVDVKKERHPEWPANYMRHITENIGRTELIFVSTHKEVRDALVQSCLFHYLVYPRIWEKKVYLDRYKERGSPQPFVDLIDKNWDSWINELQAARDGCEHVPIANCYIDLAVQRILGGAPAKRQCPACGGAGVTQADVSGLLDETCRPCGGEGKVNV